MSRTRKTHIEADPGALPVLVAMRDVKKVKAQMREKYGMEFSDEFAADLIAFVDAATFPLPTVQEDA